MPNDFAAPQGGVQGIPRAHPSQAANTANTKVYPQEEHKALQVNHARNQFKVGILESALEVSIHAGNSPQALLFRTAIDHINEVLGTTAGPDAVQKAASQDNSPQASADRIVSATTALFAAYSAKHADASSEQAAKGFVDSIRSGFEKGFTEAKDILKGLNVLSDDVQSGLTKTYDLVQQGFDNFLAAQLQPKDAAAASQIPQAPQAPQSTASTAA